MLYLHQPAIVATDPIFGNSLGFYLFTLPIYGNLASWLTALSLILLVAAVVYAALSAVSSQPPTIAEKEKAFSGFSLRAYAAVSVALGLVLIIIAWQTALSRYEYLWIDHSSFSGVTYTEANYLLPGLTIVAISLVIAAIILFINAFTKKGGRLILVAIGIPILVYIVAAVLVPTYVQSFIVKPNELDRETPYIDRNIAGTPALISRMSGPTNTPPILLPLP